jgi:hypothetical protein
MPETKRAGAEKVHGKTKKTVGGYKPPTAPWFFLS